MHRDSIVIVTPALGPLENGARDGNRQTAHRWARMLQPAYRVRLATQWLAGGDEALMIALHARRSAPSIAAWRTAHPRRPVLLTLTGTDLYRDIESDADARRSLDLADALVVLNELGAHSLPQALRGKCRVLLQSCPQRQPLAKTPRHLRALMVGHLRDEKDPATYFRAAARLAHRGDILLDHIGAALDPALGAQARALAAAQGPQAPQAPQPLRPPHPLHPLHPPHSHYRWLGAMPHAATRRRIQAAHVLVHASRMEGGAHVVIEAVRSGTPVLASRIAGNLGLLGADYAACFAVGDDAALAALLERVRDDPDMLPRLQRQLALRAPLFAPEAESARLHALVSALLCPS